MDVSLLMPCKGRADQTIALLPRLKATAGKGVTWELICIVDDDYAVAQALIEWQQANNADWLYVLPLTQRIGYWRALSVGSQQAQGRLLANIANDVLPGRNWLQWNVEVFDKLFPHGRGIVGWHDGLLWEDRTGHLLCGRVLLEEWYGEQCWPTFYDHLYGDTELCHHVGTPNPFDPNAPWGDGLDLGWCDFNAMSGGVLIESGTFHNEKIGAAVAAKADQLGLSPGFIHPLHEPDHERVFHHIHRFERSLAPKERVSNPFTALTVRKEMRRMDAVKVKALADLLGISPQDVQSTIVADAQTTEKTAQDQGVRFKTTDDMATAFKQFAALQALGLTNEQIAGTFATLKAPFPPATAEAEEVETEKAPAEEVEVEAEVPADGDNMLTAGEIKAIADATTASVLAALTPILGMEAKMGKMMDEFKASMGGLGGAVAKKDAEIAELKQQQADTAARLKTLEGDQSASTGYRASQSPEAVAAALALKAGGNGSTAQANHSDMFADWIITGQPPQQQP